MTTSPTAALDGQYSKIITARFVTTKSGAPMPCVCCGETLQVGAAYAALTAAGKWVSFCSPCSADYPTMVRRLYVTTCATVRTTEGAASDPAIREAATNLTPLLQDVVDHPADLQPFTAAKSALFALQRMVKAYVHVANVAALSENDDYVGLAHYVNYGPTRDRDFAQSLLTQWETKGSLSDGHERSQMHYVRKFAAKGHALAEAAAPDPEVDPGLYISINHKAGQPIVTRIYVRSHRLLARTYNGTTFQAERGGVKRTFDALAAGTMRLMNGAEAEAFGKQAGRCFNCLAMGRPGELSEDRSLAAGYGPDCAENNGWYYPTSAEADAILRPSTTTPATRPGSVLMIDDDGVATVDGAPLDGTV